MDYGDKLTATVVKGQ